MHEYRNRLAACVVALVVAIAASCGGAAPNQGAQGGQEIVEPGQIAESAKNVIVVLGDSLTAGLGLTTGQAFPARLQEMFAGEGYSEVEVLNAGVTGDTSAGALRRVESLIVPNVRIMVIAIGSNDALRGLSVSQTRENIEGMVKTALAADVRVMLIGMEGPTNLGTDYRDAFRALFGQVAVAYARNVNFVPFLLEGVAGDPALNQEDGIHPNDQGARIIAQNLYPRLRDMVDQLPDPAIFNTR